MNNKRLTAMLAGTLFAAVTQQAVAAKGPEYSYAELGYINVDADEIEGDGVGVNISFGATDHIFLKFGYDRVWLEESTSSLEFDADRFQIGGGMHYGITDTIDVLGAISYVDVEYSNGVPTEADEGYLVEAGVRAMLSKKLELNATLSGLHFDGEDDVGLGIGGVFDITKTFALSGSYNRFDDAEENEFFVGLRIGF
jgi:hypothetical protein